MLAETACDLNTALGNRHQEADHANRGRRYGGDLNLKKKHKTHRHANLNIGNLPTETLKNNKNNEVFELIRKYKIDFLGLAEHGLNLGSLKPSQNWANRIRGQLENSRSHLLWNEQWRHRNPRTWGGTGFILNGKANN